MVKRKKKVDHEKRADALEKELGTVKEAAWKLLRALEEPDSYTVDGDIQPHMTNLIEALDGKPERSFPSEKLLYRALGPVVGLGGSVREILGRSRRQSVALHRQMVCYALREGSSMSFPEIGAVMQLDHSTVQHAVRKIETMRAGNELQPSELAALVAAVGAVKMADERDWMEAADGG